MTRLQDMAFDYADETCDCKEGEYCQSGALQNGFEAGFKKARELIAKMVRESWNNPKYCGYTVETGLRMLGKDIESIGDEE